MNWRKIIGHICLIPLYCLLAALAYFYVLMIFEKPLPSVAGVGFVISIGIGAYLLFPNEGEK